MWHKISVSCSYISLDGFPSQPTVVEWSKAWIVDEEAEVPNLAVPVLFRISDSCDVSRWRPDTIYDMTRLGLAPREGAKTRKPMKTWRLKKRRERREGTPAGRIRTSNGREEGFGSKRKNSIKWWMPIIKERWREEIIIINLLQLATNSEHRIYITCKNV